MIDPSRTDDNTEAVRSFNDHVASRVDCDADGGAPLCRHDWCTEMPRMTEAQFFTGFVIAFVIVQHPVALGVELSGVVIGGVLVDAGRMRDDPRPVVRRGRHDPPAPFRTEVDARSLLY